MSPACGPTNRRKRQRSKSYELACNAYFFDNSADNFEGCDRRVVRIKVDETKNDAEATTREAALARAQQGAADAADDALAAEVIMKTCEFTIDKLHDTSVVVDPRSGINQSQFDYVAQRARVGDLVFLDFDRALSVIEGFLFKTARWDQYLLGAKANFGVAEETTADDLIRAHLGGAARADLVADGLRALIQRVGSANVYVLTNNCNVFLIEGVMAWLNARMRSRWETMGEGAREGGDAAPAPVFADGHVLSTHAINLVGASLCSGKCDVIHTVIEQTASGTISGTLLRWRMAANQINVHR